MIMLVEALAQSSETGRPFWHGLMEGVLMLPFCARCQKPFFYPRRITPCCQATEFEWRPSKGTGRVFAISIVHLAFQGANEADLPYATGLVDLDEGIRLPARFPHDPAPLIGDRVAPRFDPAGKNYPLFAPMGDAR